jgi:eukaryotic-like serine/threonine-protein kinase
MRLNPGARLGPYELIGPLGAGGMGEVYRARDARLNRDVAIKILPPLFAADPERIARFDREAQVLGSLNHPNIAHIYGIEDAHAASAPTAEGERSAGWPAKSDTQLRALVMELVEGEDLSERIARGPLPLGDALAIARQIAEALSCAHEHGIVHRDLKPANVKVREDGTVKVLDFGLARLVEPSSGSSPSAALSPTITSPATQLGVILGTAAYMAPEQARGKPVDKRADIWTFGVVLYEMLTGRRAFEGSEVSDTLAFILTKDPDWAALPAETAAPIRRLLRRCLQKDPRQRLADMSDARLELDEAASPLDSARAGPLIKRSRWLVPAMAAGIVVAALLGGVAAWSLLRPSAAPSSPLASFSIPLPEGAEFTNAGRHVVAISQDGRRIVYVANRQLYVREIGSVGVTPIAGSETAGAVVGPAFSPDGEQVVYYSEGALRRIAVAGGTPMPVAATGSPLGVHWAADGIFVGLGAGGIGRIPVEGGKLVTIATVGPDESAQGQQLLPGGDVIIFTIATGVLETRWDKARIVAHSLRSGERKVLIEGGSDARYVPTGHLTICRERRRICGPV